MIKVLTKRERIILYATIGVIFFAIIFNAILFPLAKKNSELNKRISLAQQKLKNYIWLLSQKDVILNKYSLLTSSVNGSGKENQIVAGLTGLENMAKEANVRIIDIRPQPEVKSHGSRGEGVIELRAEGEAEAFLKFIYEIEKSLALLKIKKFQLSSRPNSQTLEARFTITQLFVSE